jgi:hypothetical protein
MHQHVRGQTVAQLGLVTALGTFVYQCLGIVVVDE